MRRILVIHNDISLHHLDRYLAEVTWRINQLHNRLESLGYWGDGTRNLSLMRDVLAGSSGGDVRLGDL